MDCLFDVLREADLSIEKLHPFVVECLQANFK